MKGKLSILAIGDPHFKENNAEQTAQMVRKITELVQVRKPDLIVCLGDVLDKHARLHVDPLCQAVNFFQELSIIAPLVVIIGNHDRRNNSDFMTDRHPFTALKKWPNVTIADKVHVRQINGHQLIFVPYVPPGLFIDALNSYHPSKDNSYLNYDTLAENRSKELNLVENRSKEENLVENRSKELNLVENRSKEENLVENRFKEQNLDENRSKEENLVENRFKELNSVENRSKEEILIEHGSNDYQKLWWWKASIIFAHQEFYGAKMGAVRSEKGDKWPVNAPLVVSGHIHDYDHLQSNVWYTGTPMQHSFGDTLDKTVSMLFWNDQNNVWAEERIDLGLIKRKTIRVNVNEFMKLSIPPGYLLKVIVEGTPSEIKTLRALPRIEALRQNGIVVSIKTLVEKNISEMKSSLRNNQSYLTALYTELNKTSERNGQLLAWFNKIFGQYNTVNHSNKSEKPIKSIRLVLKTSSN